ncbi:hypothetical protein V5799_008977 [Amblyomma americanum]|uniref:Uncharacterized protein n=1 Tax=Amblyomma americanum TaxID=6943 RepID=A0AAQ4FDH8_AMBAM
MYHRSTPPPSPQRRLDGDEPPSPTGSGGRPRHLPVHEPYTQPPCVRRGMQVLSSRQYDLHIHSARGVGSVARCVPFVGPDRQRSRRMHAIMIEWSSAVVRREASYNLYIEYHVLFTADKLS